MSKKGRPTVRAGRPLARLSKRNAAALAKLDQATREIRRLKGAIGQSFYDMGRVLAGVRDKKLYLARGHRTFEDYLDVEAVVKRSAAYAFIRIATTFERRFAISKGSTWLEASLRYIEATPEDEKPSDVPRLAIPIESQDGKSRRKPIAAASVREIRQAAHTARRTREARAPGAEEAARFVERAKEKLDTANLEAERVQTEWSPGRRAHVVSVEGVKLANAWRTFEILAKVARTL